MLSVTHKTSLEQSLSEKLKSNVNIKNFTLIGGGCINDAQRMDTSAGVFFIKWNDAKKHPGMFEAEAKGGASFSPYFVHLHCNKTTNK